MMVENKMAKTEIRTLRDILKAEHPKRIIVIPVGIIEIPGMIARRAIEHEAYMNGASITYLPELPYNFDSQTQEARDIVAKFKPDMTIIPSQVLVFRGSDSKPHLFTGCVYNWSIEEELKELASYNARNYLLLEAEGIEQIRGRYLKLDAEKYLREQLEIVQKYFKIAKIRKED